jgi:hypothetical protein
MARCILCDEAVSDIDKAFVTVAQTKDSGAMYPVHKNCPVRAAVPDYPLPFRDEEEKGSLER